MLTTNIEAHSIAHVAGGQNPLEKVIKKNDLRM